MKYLVIDIGGTFTKYAVMDENAAFYEKGKIPTAKESEEDFLHMIEELYERYRDDAGGIAISAPGFIDGERGFMRTAGSIFCVHDLDIVPVLESRLNIPVTVENDARCAAVAEMDRGSLKGCADSAVIIIGTALGGTIFCGGRMLRGKDLFAGEFSYMLSDADDALNPKKLLAETAGAPALIRLAAEETGIPVEELDGEKVFDMAQNGDERVLKALRRYTRRIAAHIMNCQFMGYMQACMGPHFSELDRSSVLEPAPDKEFMPLDDGDRFDLGGLHIDTYAMPGHTPGCMVFLIRELRTLILGDACNNSTFLFDDDAGYLDEYAGMLRNLRDRLTGTYDHVYLSHHDMETGTDIMDNVLEVCREAAEEKADDIPYDFMGHHAFIAKKCDERFRREDGKCGNIIYSKEKLFKKC